ncbi:hypothetical protein Bca4012_077281 [Brassica carinata]|uniref:Uncharacterized protein n=1 Tax=Brassica carinata TaxID=52824 RepID=A0A8X7Q7Z4_BRACI|nr:hypothetical protein Bca52824_072433 [Brassica carinata]
MKLYDALHSSELFSRFGGADTRSSGICDSSDRRNIRLPHLPHSIRPSFLCFDLSSQKLLNFCTKLDNWSLHREATAQKKTEAVLSNDYYESDIAWMDLLGSINVLTSNVAILSEICRPHEVINGHYLNEHAVLDGVDGASSRGPLINVYLLDQAAKDFYIKFNESLASPAVLLVATNKVWYYIACSDCHTKANRGPTSFMFPKNAETSTSLELYHVHAEVSVYESGQKATFVLIGNAGPELIGRHASELFDNYGERNGDMGANHEMPALQ